MEECTCFNNGCSERRQKTVHNGFPKKLLVATSVVVIITMCLIPAEAGAIGHVKLRHERRHGAIGNPKDARMMVPDMKGMEHRRRPRRKHIVGSTPDAKDPTDSRRLQRNPQSERFKKATKIIFRQFRNTRTCFLGDISVLNETREYRDGMPSWLPAMNFVDIHDHNYRTPRRHGVTVTEKKFTYLMPKLYKSLVEFREIFILLLKVEVDIPDDPFCAYNRTRHELISKVLNKLHGTINEIKDNMILLHTPVPNLTPHKHLNRLQLRIDAPQCLKNDYIAFRAYRNLLNNWYMEFKCPKGKPDTKTNEKCQAYEAKLQEKKNTRGKKKGSS